MWFEFLSGFGKWGTGLVPVAIDVTKPLENVSGTNHIVFVAIFIENLKA